MSYALRSRKRFSPEELALLCIALALGAVIAGYVYALGLTKSLTDQSAHLNFARLTFESLTPGISQLGFWPPLLHVLLIPFVAIPALYVSGLAGAFVLIPILALGTWCMYKITRTLTGSRRLSMLAGLILVLNPYVLYYSVTPMMEVLFLTAVLGAAYAMILWLRTERLHYLLYSAAFVSLATVSRYEGLMLLPITGLVILGQLYRKRRTYGEMEALVLIFSLLAVTGTAFIVIYSWVYGGSIFTFIGGDWLRDPQDVRVAGLNVLESFSYVIYASFHMIGFPLVVTSFLSAPVLLLLASGKRFEVTATLLMLFSPFLFIWIAVYSGSITINVPNLPPFDGFFHNDRYGLTWIGAAILTPVLLLHELKRHSVAFRRNRRIYAYIRPPLFLVLTLAPLIFFHRTIVEERYSVIVDNINSPSADQREIAAFLRSHYDYGNIIMARVDNDPILAEVPIPFSRVIYEGNFRYFDQALQEPWLFARWMLMHNPERSLDEWAVSFEPVYREWGTDERLDRYYELVHENETRRLYRLKEEAVIEMAAEGGYNVRAIPSLNPTRSWWSPQTIYDRMVSGRSNLTTDRVLRDREALHDFLLVFYTDLLQPEYASGYYASPAGNGNSESQSYAMLQALWADDPHTFDIVWRWTKENLQREDALFAWKFSMDDDGNITIIDANSATDADTDIAYALLEASRRWARTEYEREALPIIRAIWEYQTGQNASVRHVIAGRWAQGDGIFVLNPSYFSPFSYRLFQQYDTENDWRQLIVDGYRDLERVAEYMEATHGAYLPPNWVAVEEESGSILPFPYKDDAIDYSYDAFRTFWRVALDHHISSSHLSRSYLRRATVFKEEWQRNDQLCSVYLFSEETPRCYANITALAGPLSIWAVTDRKLASELVSSAYFRNGEVNLSDQSDFYERSWVWFSLWLWHEMQR